MIAGDVPIGAGLSSSAAIELAAARTFCAVAGIDWNAPEMAKLCQRVENEWIGVKTGIMDQMISATGVADHAVLIDCRWLHLDPVPLPPGTAVVVLDTATRRELVTSEYGKRREQCETAARFFNVPALRDVTLPQLEARRDLMDDVVYRRARHVVSENQRTLDAADAMRVGRRVTLGQLMNASHASLRDDFEISSDALNLIVECAREHEACIGARMTGGGFGGCAVALVRADAAEDFAQNGRGQLSAAQRQDARRLRLPRHRRRAIIMRDQTNVRSPDVAEYNDHRSRWMRSVAAMSAPQHPGAALLVIDHDAIVYTKGYGLADLATNQPITTDTSFYLASLSKQFSRDGDHAAGGARSAHL